MSWRHLGETFDIHAGGIDLVFPHHENEVAQSRCCFGTPVMANVWLHNGFLQVEGEKMAKSAGNFVTIHELLATDRFGGRSWPGEVLRLAMLRAHYRQPIDWTVRSLEEADRELDRWYPLAAGSEAAAASPEFLDALTDDLNTPEAITRIRELYGRAVSGEPEAAPRLAACGRLIGLFGHALPDWLALRQRRAGLDADRIERLIGLRATARAARDWAESDRIRDELAALGVRVKDNKDGTTSWEAAR